MEVDEDIVIVGAGIAGLTTSLGLHKLGIRSLVLESSDELRTAGYALTLWTNAWKALDAVGIGDSLRLQHDLLDGDLTVGMCLPLLFRDLKLQTHHLRSKEISKLDHQ
ncbi:monooxygenase 2-like isoform X1 [Quercus suber]|uniref:monooxygenase 2-like isoform X1 n=1 Tax=Quercus suber TaxID=58331 RepID=UPI0032DEAEA2